MAKKLLKVVLKVIVWLAGAVDVYFTSKAWRDVVDVCIDSDEDTKLALKAGVDIAAGSIIGVIVCLYNKRIDRM